MTKELKNFLTWAEENQILWDKEAIEIRESKHGLGVFAKKKLEEGYEVVQVPKAIVLSVQTTGIANLLQEVDIEGYVGLAIGCLYEISRGDQSPWAPYLALLAKRPPPMATSLPQESRDMMKSAEVYGDIESDLKDMVTDYETIVLPFLDQNADVFTKELREKHFTLENFKTVIGHISSRAMDVDNFHVEALVPFADFVNHSPEPNADYLSHEEVCEICGALACEHMEDEDDEDSEEESGAEGSDDDDEPPELTTKEDAAAAANKKKAAKKDQDEDEEMEGEDWEDEDDEDDDEDEEINDTCDIILDTDVKKGEEILRHYGPYPNKVLMSKYGFAVVDNPHDTVTIQLEMVRKAAEGILKDPKLVEERIEWFLKTEDAFIGTDDDDHEHGGGCCGGGDHDHDHEHGHGEEEHEHEHAADGGCCDTKGDAKKSKNASKGKDAGEEEEEDEDEEDDDEEEEDDFPRDIMYMMHDGSVDDRLLMLLNVLFMEKDQFAKVDADMDVAMPYFNEIFQRREQEEHGNADEEDEEEDEEDEEKVVLGPRDEASKKVRKAVLEAILALIRIRADAFGVSDKTTAEQDLKALQKAKLPELLFYGGVCVQGEKQILQNGLQGYASFLADLK